MGWTKEDARQYRRAYSRFTRHFDEYLEKAFAEYDELRIDKLIEKLAEVSKADEQIGISINMSPDTVRKHIRQYQIEAGKNNNIEEVYKWKNPAESQP